MRSFLLIVPFVFLLGVGSEKPAQKADTLTLEVRATSLENLVKEINEKVQLDLRVDASLKDEIMTIRVDRMDVKKLLDTIAYSVTGEWVIQDGKRVLLRTQKTQKELERQYYTRLESAIKKVQDSEKQALRADMPSLDIYRNKLVEGIKRDKQAGEIEHRSGQLNFERFVSGVRPPASISLLNFVANVLPASAARVGPSEISTFAFPNNNFQLPLPNGKTQCLDSFNDYNGAVFDLVGDSPSLLNTKEFPGNIYLDNMFQEKAVKCIATLRLQLNFFSCVLTCYDAQGKLVGSAVKYWNLDQYFDPLQTFAQEVPDVERKLNFSKLASAYLRAIPKNAPIIHPRFVKNPDPIPMQSILKEAMGEPLKVDPLSHLTTEVLWSLAKELDKPIIACLDDDLDSISRQAVNEGVAINLRRFVSVAEQKGNTTFEDKEGTLVVRPASAFQAENRRVNRKVLQGMMRSAFAQRKISFRDFAKFVYSSGPHSFNSQLLAYWLQALSLEHIFNYGIRYCRPMVLLVGSLNDQQYDQMLKGSSLSYASMSAEQRKLLIDWMSFQTPSWRNVEREIGRGELIRQPTEIAQWMDKSKTSFTLDFIDATVLQTANRATTVEGMGDFVCKPENFANYLSAHEKGLEGSDSLSPDGFFLGSCKQTVARLNFSEDLLLELKIEEENRMDKSKTVKWSDVPEDFKRDTLRELVWIQKMIKAREGSGG